MSRWIAAALIALTPLLARADRKQFVDERTLFVAEADLTKVDPAVVEPWVRNLLKAAGVIDSPTAPPASEVDLVATECKRWLADVAAAGGKRVYVVTNADIVNDGPMAIVIPAEAGGDAKKLASLLSSGRADGSTNQPTSGRPPRYARQAQVVNGNVAVFGTSRLIEYVRKLKPVDRPDVNA